MSPPACHYKQSHSNSVAEEWAIHYKQHVCGDLLVESCKKIGDCLSKLLHSSIHSWCCTKCSENTHKSSSLCSILDTAFTCTIKDVLHFVDFSCQCVCGVDAASSCLDNV